MKKSCLNSVACLVLFGLASVADAAVISTNRFDIWDAATKTIGSNVISAVADGETWSFTHVSASDPISGFDTGTIFSPQNLTSLFGGTFAGDYDSGMGSTVSYVTPDLSIGSTQGSQLSAIAGFQQISVAGTLMPGTTTGTTDSYVDMTWALIAFDADLSAYNILSSGGFRATSIGGINDILEYSNLSGDGLTVSGNTTLDTGDWIGIFYQKTGQSTTGGTHFNFVDSDIVYSMSSVPVPAAFWLFSSGLLGLVGIARRKKA